MHRHGRRLWFRAKSYGWGWYPATWEGYLVTVLFVLAIAARTAGFVSDPVGNAWLLVFDLIIASALFMAVAALSGEKPYFAWAGRHVTGLYVAKEVGLAGFFVALSFAAGALGALAMNPESMAWYQGLTKPFWAPPDYLFAPVWTLLYAAMGIATYLVAKARTGDTKSALELFVAHLVVNASWSIFFFGFQNILLALAIIGVLFAMILLLILLYYRASAWAAALLVPYACWVLFATMLNLTLYLANPFA